MKKKIMSFLLDVLLPGIVLGLLAYIIVVCIVPSYLNSSSQPTATSTSETLIAIDNVK